MDAKVEATALHSYDAVSLFAPQRSVVCAVMVLRVGPQQAIIHSAMTRLRSHRAFLLISRSTAILSEVDEFVPDLADMLLVSCWM